MWSEDFFSWLVIFFNSIELSYFHRQSLRRAFTNGCPNASVCIQYIWPKAKISKFYLCQRKQNRWQTAWVQISAASNVYDTACHSSMCMQQCGVHTLLPAAEIKNNSKEIHLTFFWLCYYNCCQQYCTMYWACVQQVRSASKCICLQHVNQENEWTNGAVVVVLVVVALKIELRGEKKMRKKEPARKKALWSFGN